MLLDTSEGCLEEEAIELGIVGGRIYTKRRRARRSSRAKGLAQVERTECAEANEGNSTKGWRAKGPGMTPGEQAS